MRDPKAATHPVTSLDPQRLEALALALFDVRAACEADLRALTSMQRSLERIRCARTTNKERELLLGEIARLLDQSATTSDAIADLRRQAHDRVEGCREQMKTAALAGAPHAVPEPA